MSPGWRRTAGVLLAASLAACAADAFGPEDACRLAGEHVLLPDDDEYQQLDLGHYPASGYKSVEILECTEFLSKAEDGWASVRVHGRGDEFDLDTGQPLGRTIFTVTVELQRTPDGWRAVDKGKLGRRGGLGPTGS